MLMIFMYLIKTEMFSGKRELCLFSTEVCSKKHGTSLYRGPYFEAPFSFSRRLCSAPLFGRRDVILTDVWGPRCTPHVPRRRRRDGQPM